MTPSWYGDSVGHYEGDTLVIDTVGMKVGKYSMVDWYGTPHSEALHVVERYRMLDYAAAKEGFERDAKEHNVPAGCRSRTRKASICSSTSRSRIPTSSRRSGARP